MKSAYLPLLLPALFAIPLEISAQDQEARFQHLRIEDGLSQSTVWSIFQDSRGFMWFGTQDGLNRYDGYDLEIFAPDPDDPKSLSNNDVRVMYEDRSGTLWVGTENGLNRYDRALENFTRFLNDPADPTTLSQSKITALFEDREGLLWVGTTTGGLNAFDPENGTFKRYRHDPSVPNSLSSDVVTVITQDRSGGLLIGTESGLNLLDRENDGFIHLSGIAGPLSEIGNQNITAIRGEEDGTLWVGTGIGLFSVAPSWSSVRHFTHSPYDESSLSHNAVTSIEKDRQGVLWIGTDGGGINALDRDEGTFLRFQQDPFRAESLSADRVLSIFEDMSGMLWVGTYSSGVDRFDHQGSKFTSNSGRPGSPSAFSDHVRAFLVDRTGTLWVGLEGNGITRIDRPDGATGLLTHDASDPSSLSNDRVFSLLEDDAGTVWVGTSGGGLNEFHRDTGAFTLHRIEPPDSVNIRENAVRDILEDRNGMLWIGTDGGGLHSFDRESGEVVHYQNIPGDSRSLGNNQVFSLLEDASGTLWIGTFGAGLNRFEKESGTFTRFQSIRGDPNSLANDYVIALLEDPAGTIWIGSNGGGLVKFNPKTESFVRYGQKHGLANTSVYAILGDDDSHIWVSHNKGLSRFDRRSERFTNFDVTDGLQSNEFNGGAAYRSPAGELFFGGIDGYNAFFPATLQDDQDVPPVLITDLQLYNRSVTVGEGAEGPLTSSIIETDSLTLSHSDEVFSFQYAALAFRSTESVEYAYIMEGFEKEWNEVGSRRFATYTSLPPGDYTFKVRASNGDGVWKEEGASLAITIVPPFWMTLWFISLAGIAALSLVWGLHQNRTRLIRVRAKVLEQKVGERTSDLKREISERKEIEKRLEYAHQEALLATRAKSEFLANMSHEIRTPMNGVLGMTQLILDTSDLSPDLRDQAETIYASGEALLTIINDILDFSKIEAGKLDIEPIPFDLQVASSEVADLMAVKAIEKGVELVVRYSPDAARYLVGDAGRVRQIMLNIVGNAIKFTSEGHVLIEVEEVGKGAVDATVKISVHDTGIGMDEGARVRLFQPFSQADASTTRKFGGTGLGLAICKQLVELMGGEVGVESTPGEGSTFWFTLCLPRMKGGVPEALPRVELAGVRTLIVDDIAVNRRVLREQLTNLGMVPEVVDSGDGALERLRAAAGAGNPFPLAILDFHMPEMNGEELGRIILSDESFGNPALVLLTSAGSAGDGPRLETAGFSGYLVKPTRADTLRDVLATVWAAKQGIKKVTGIATRHSVAEARAAVPEPASEIPETGRWRVLVAEDNIVNQKVAKRMLEKLGCIVDVAANGEEAVHMWSQLPYDIVFMDVQMPEMDGLAATRAIRNREGDDRHTPVVAMTANAMDGDQEICLDAGMDDYLAKPINMNECREALEKWGQETSLGIAAQVHQGGPTT